MLLICVDDLKPMLGCYGDATREVAEYRCAGGARRAVQSRVLQSGRVLAVAECAADGSAADDARDLRPGDELSREPRRMP